MRISCKRLWETVKTHMGSLEISGHHPILQNICAEASLPRRFTELLVPSITSILALVKLPIIPQAPPATGVPRRPNNDVIQPVSVEVGHGYRVTKVAAELARENRRGEELSIYKREKAARCPVANPI